MLGFVCVYIETCMRWTKSVIKNMESTGVGRCNSGPGDSASKPVNEIRNHCSVCTLAPTARKDTDHYMKVIKRSHPCSRGMQAASLLFIRYSFTCFSRSIYKNYMTAKYWTY